MGKILVVDDAEFMRLRYRKLLVGEGHEVLEAGNGKEALKVFDMEQPDLVLLDITMPVMDGLEALREIRARDGDANVVMSSALGQESVVIAAIKGGAKDFLVKPFQPDKVLAIVNKFVSY